MKNLFKKAHEMTREIASEYEVDYQVQFSLCLQYLATEEENEVQTEEDLKNGLIKVMEEEYEEELSEVTHFSSNVWKKYGKKRVYVELNFTYAGGQRGNFKVFIDYTDEDRKFIRDMSGVGSRLYNSMMKAGFNFTKENALSIIEMAEEV